MNIERQFSTEDAFQIFQALGLSIEARKAQHAEMVDHLMTTPMMVEISAKLIERLMMLRDRFEWSAREMDRRLD